MYNNNKFEITPPAWRDEFKFPDGSYSISDIQDYFEFIIWLLLHGIPKNRKLNRCNAKWSA